MYHAGLLRGGCCGEVIDRRLLRSLNAASGLVRRACLLQRRLAFAS